MLHIGVGRAPKLRRLTPQERWALVAGAWALAAESPVRGALLIAEGVPVETRDVADAAGVSLKVAQNALEKSRKLSLIETIDGVEWVHDWHDYNPDPRPSDSPEAVAERKRRQRERERERQEREGHDPSVTQMSRVTEGDVTPGRRREGKEKGTSEPDGSDTTTTKDLSSSLTGQRQQPASKGQTGRASDREETAEIAGLCDLLAELIERNGSKAPTAAQKRSWARDVRLMVERDGRKFEEIEGAIRWCQADSFWRANVLSMGKLRDQFDRMRLQAQRRAGSTKAAGNAEVLAMLRAQQGQAA